MKVLHVLNTGTFSGAENVIIQIIRNLSNDSNLEFAYCSLDGNIGELLSKYNINYYPMSKLNSRNLKKVVKEFKPDLIHAHDFRASVLSSKIGITCISHLHNNDPKMKKISLKSVLYYLAIKKFSTIFSVSDSVWDEFIFKNKCKDKKFINIGNPINVNEIVDKSTEYDCNEKYDVGFVGRLTEQKNPLLLIDIIAELKKEMPNIKVAILGDGLLRAETEKKSKELGLESNVTFMGFVNNPLPIMKRFKVFCLTSSWEGFGLVAIEALSLGVPVVCSKVGGLPTIVDEDCGSLCDSKEEFIIKINELLSNNDLLNKKKNNAIARSKALDNSKEFFEKIKNVYFSTKR